LTPAASIRLSDDCVHREPFCMQGLFELSGEHFGGEGGLEIDAI
jgi:hypothetical protein